MKKKKVIVFIIILSFGLIPTIFLSFIPIATRSVSVDGVEREVTVLGSVMMFKVQFTAGENYTIEYTTMGSKSVTTRISDSFYFITGKEITGTSSSGMFDITQRMQYTAQKTGTYYIRFSNDYLFLLGSFTIKVTLGAAGANTGTVTDIIDVSYPIIMLLPVIITAIIGILVVKFWDSLAFKLNPTPTTRKTSNTSTGRRESFYAGKSLSRVGKNIEIKRQFEHLSGFIRVKVKISNNSSYVITNVRFQLELSEAFILRRVEPDYEMKADELQIGEINSNSEKTIGFTIEPQICGREKLYGNLEYRDHTGVPKVESMSPIEVEVVCPLFFTEEEANVAKLTNLIRTKLRKSDERCYAIPKGLEPSLAFTILRDTIERHHVKFVSEDIHEKPTFEAHAWYYGKSKVHELDFVIQVIVSESSQSMKIIVDCGNNVALTGFLSELGRQMRNGILESGAITSIGDLKALRCPACAAPLSKFPKPGETVTCGYCNYNVTFF
ncbi:MAG: hypothetical protein EAX96_04705 [Candidatus Lokiarchaeota archaeon]|nr:hypothetical protein [Candidatus Lokiarchaeota archaeon]